MPRGRLWLNQVTMNAPVCIRPYDPAESSGEDMVSVIIPVLNEAPTIASVVGFAWRSPRVSEVIVVDDGSIDGTPDLARAAGARVVTSTMLGKGGSMEDGVGLATNETLLYLDGDLRGLAPDLVERVAAPILAGEVDFVKARFTRSAGRVTMLTARPLLRIYFPELTHFEQPLGGIIAARRGLLRSLRFENDYGVDIGLLIDAIVAKARVAEIDVGHLEHDSQPLERLEEMAVQVARTILDRAARLGRLRYSFASKVQETERHQRAELAAALGKIPQGERLALFDMDGVILQGRFIVELARRTNRESALEEFLDRFDLTAEERARKIAAIFAGVPCEAFEHCARVMPLMPGAVEAVVGLRKAGFRVGVVTDSFDTASEIVRRRVFADFSFANLMKFRNGHATGQLTLAPAMVHPHGCRAHRHCKANVMLHLIEKLGIGRECVLAVGDGENDRCMLRQAGCSVAFQPKT
ncbi:MAG: hypothetical protein DME25_17110, partial [Verrucomicrobia bacterium]